MSSKNNKSYCKTACKCQNLKLLAITNNRSLPFRILNIHLSPDTLPSLTQLLKTHLWICNSLINPRRNPHKTMPICNKTQVPAWRQKLQTKSRGRIPRRWLFHRVKLYSRRSNGACRQDHNNINHKWLEATHRAHLERLAWVSKINRTCSLYITRTAKLSTKTRAAWWISLGLSLRNRIRRKAWSSIIISNINNKQCRKLWARLSTWTPSVRSLQRSCLWARKF